MIDFPASPTVGQQFTAAGVTWTWDGTKWAASGLSVAYLPLAGGTLTGVLSLAPPAGNYPQLVFSKATGSGGSTNVIYGMVGSAGRWEMDLGDGGAESGGNAGSNFVIKNYADNGSVLGTSLSITRASGQVTIPNLSAPQAIGDNRIINGDMRIDQRWNGASGTAIGYTVDRWQYSSNQAAKGTWQRGSFGPPQFPYCLSFTASATPYTPLATDFFQLVQTIEADMISDFAWGTANAQPVTLSFWAYSIAGTFGGSLRNAAGTRSYPFTYVIQTASVWTKIAVTIPGDTAGTWVMSGNAASITVSFDLGSGSTYRAPAGAWAAGNFVGANGAANLFPGMSAFYLTGVKLEIGSVATPYNRQSLAQSMIDCQRYYQMIDKCLWSPYASVAGQVQYMTILFPVAMRAAPTCTLGNPSNANVTSAAFIQTYPSSTGFQATLTAATQGIINYQGNTFSAEL